MANVTGTIKIPIFARLGSKDIEVGALEVDVKVTPGGRLVSPSSREIQAALRKGLR